VFVRATGYTDLDWLTNADIKRFGRSVSGVDLLQELRVGGIVVAIQRSIIHAEAFLPEGELPHNTLRLELVLFLVGRRSIGIGHKLRLDFIRAQSIARPLEVAGVRCTR
jgi:hypothetical protein